MPRSVFALLLAVLCLTGCDTLTQYRDERYSRHNEKGDAWLSDQILPPEINITGQWQSSDWGDSSFYQEGNRLNGHLGDYPIKGVVSGNKAYLLVGSGGWYYFSAILEMPGQNILIGYSSRTVPYIASRRSDLRLDRK